MYVAANAEDMGLDIALTETDARKRLAYVATFAMSSYYGTIGLIAKPFQSDA